MRLLYLLVLSALALAAQPELRFALRADPITLDPMLVKDDASETIRYLTGGVLMRLNRITQKLEGELAHSWQQSPDGKRLTVKLCRGVKFSDGSPFDAADVVHTFQVLTSPANRNPTADSFRFDEKPATAQRISDFEVAFLFPVAVANAARLFDQVAIVSSRSPNGTKAVLGPWQVAEHRRGSHILLQANPNYWKKDSTGKQTPYIRQLRIPIQPNRDLEAMAFRRDELDLISGVDPRIYDELAREFPDRVHDIGPSFDIEFLWFNQAPHAKIPEYKKAWFGNAAFRRAVSAGIDRADLCRIVYKGHAIPAAGFYPPANQVWYDRSLKPHREDVATVRKMFTAAGFRESGGVLRDAAGNPVSFTIMTNAGSRTREQIAALIQRDLKRFGIQISIATLDFGALLERIGSTQAYETCLLGFVNADRDPTSAFMNVLLSSGTSHAWNPKQASPAAPWEAEIDKLMRAQATSASEKTRVDLFARVQTILAEQEPCAFLLHPNVLAAWHPRLKNIKPASLRPNLLWNAETIYFDGR